MNGDPPATRPIIPFLAPLYARLGEPALPLSCAAAADIRSIARSSANSEEFAGISRLVHRIGG